MIDQDGADTLEEMERYASAGTAPIPRRLQHTAMDDERMSEEWNRARNQQGEVVGFLGQRPIIRSSTDTEEADKGGEKKGSSDTDESSAGVMAALARLRRQEDD